MSKNKKKGMLFLLVLLPLLVILVLLFAQYHADISVEKIKEEYGKPISKFVDIDGMAVHYCDEGKGMPLLLIHGTAASLHTWDAWAKYLKNYFRVLRLDLPGFGLTGAHPQHKYAIADYTNFVDQFLNKMGIDSCYLAGNSLGGNIAWHYTATHPQKVQRLVLLDASGFPSDAPPPLAFSLAQNSITRPLLRHITPRRLIEKSLLEVYGDDDLVTDALIDRYHRLLLREGNRDAYIARLNTPYKDKTDLLKKINIPTLILWGTWDEWVPVEHAYLFEKAISKSELKFYDNVGHIPMEENPDESAYDTRIFLEDNR